MGENVGSQAVAWSETLWINAIRALSAGVTLASVITYLAYSNTRSGSPTVNLAVIWTVPLLFPLIHLSLSGFIVGICVPFLRLFGLEYICGPSILIFSLFIMPGDPLLFVLRLWKQWIVPCEVFYPVNLGLFPKVLKPSGEAMRGPAQASGCPPAALTLAVVGAMGFVGLVLLPDPAQTRKVRTVSHALAFPPQSVAVNAIPASDPPAASLPCGPTRANQTSGWIVSPNGMLKARIEPQPPSFRATEDLRLSGPIDPDHFALVVRHVAPPFLTDRHFEVGPGIGYDFDCKNHHKVSFAGWSPRSDLIALNYETIERVGGGVRRYLVFVGTCGKEIRLQESDALMSLQRHGVKLPDARYRQISVIGFATQDSLRISIRTGQLWDDPSPIQYYEGTYPFRVFCDTPLSAIASAKAD
jgi:hypothetical protein